MPFILTPPGSTDLESLEFDGLALNDTVFGLAEFHCPPPPERPEWIGAADSEAQLLARTPLHENRDITLKLQVAPQVNMDLALDKIGSLLDKCVKAPKYQDGIELAWNPATSARFVTFDVLSAQITDLPVDWENGWLAFAPTITVAMKAKPYWRGEETLTSTTSSSTPFVTAELVNNSGDVPALGRLIVTDTASQSRRHVEWGLEGPLTYNASTSLLIDSDDLVTSGFAGTGATATGAYDPNATGNSIITCSLFSTSPIAVCGTGNLSHVGSFRVRARMNMSGEKKVRLAWQVGDGPFSNNAWVTPINQTDANWYEYDLGTITIPEVLSGTQRWTGRVEASDAAPTGTIYLDYLRLIPVTAGYGKARAVYSYTPGVATGYDNFTGTTAGNNLNARTAVSGGSWATSGATTDFTFTDLTDALSVDGEGLVRATNSDAGRRFAILGSTNYTDTEVSSDVGTFGAPSVTTYIELGVIARWVDSSNYLLAYRKAETGATTSDRTRSLVVEQVVAGVTTVLGSVTLPRSTPSSNVTHQIRLVVYASGRFVAVQTTEGATWTVEGTSSALSTGGALDDGKIGLADSYTGTGSIIRNYDNFFVATPAAEPIALYSGQSIEFRHDDTIREDSTGTYYGRPPSYRGSRFLVPVGTSRVAVAARRNDIDATAAPNVTDATQIQVGVTPRGLAVPRS